MPANAQSRLSGFLSGFLAHVSRRAGGRGVEWIALPLVSPLFDARPGRASWASLWRDALRPDTSNAARRAAEGKGGAAWRRDRKPRAATRSARLRARARRGPTPCPQRAPGHPCCLPLRRSVFHSQAVAILR